MDNGKCCGNCGNGKCKCGNKCGGKVACLCPVSFGLALGITCGLAMFCWSVWLMYYGVPEMMGSQMHMMVPMTWMAVMKHSLLCLVKGAIFGFVLVIIYDMIVCCGKKFCCKDKNGKC